MLWIVACTAPACAQKMPWTWYSPNRVYRFNIEDAVKRGGEWHGLDKSTCTLSRSRGGRYVKVWSSRMPSHTQYMKALVSDDGRWVATTDQAYRGEYARDVVVVYGRDGGIARRRTLEQLFSEHQIRRLPGDESPLHWLSCAWLDAKLRCLALAGPYGGFQILELDTGRLRPGGSPELLSALTQGFPGTLPLAAESAVPGAEAQLVRDVATGAVKDRDPDGGERPYTGPNPSYPAIRAQVSRARGLAIALVPHV